jgi:hypothetical protein
VRLSPPLHALIPNPFRVFTSQYHPLSDLQHDWETFVINTVQTQDGKEMRVRDTTRV